MNVSAPVQIGKQMTVSCNANRVIFKNWRLFNDDLVFYTSCTILRQFWWSLIRVLKIWPQALELCVFKVKPLIKATTRRYQIVKERKIKEEFLQGTEAPPTYVGPQSKKVSTMPVRRRYQQWSQIKENIDNEADSMKRCTGVKLTPFPPLPHSSPNYTISNSSMFIHFHPLSSTLINLHSDQRRGCQ